MIASSWKGGAGNAAAFGQRYTGGEPVAAPRAQFLSGFLRSIDARPVALQQERR
ncbi:MAG: hypothetical protein U5J78_02065 [Parasphingorhabdus sp.]|nr:hypothetical protein [Parasphingorhabdus sp.]